ncbi:MAG: hypothetical protein N2689_00395 [Verrucomicrobiae bacterium]|nr:hypothetical protein [Verrucomicrobiae bacterium]
MKDRRLEQQVEALDDFLDRWQRFGDYLRRGFQRQPAAPGEEHEFLTVKGELAQDYEVLMAGFSGERDPQDKTLAVLAEAASLQRLGEMSDAEMRAVEAAWHHSYIELQGLLGRLKARKLQLASVSALGYYIGQVLRSPVFILLLMGIVIAAAVWLWNFTQPSSDNLIEPRGPRPIPSETTPRP